MSCSFNSPHEDEDNVCRNCGIDLDNEYITYEGDLCPECYWVCENEEFDDDEDEEVCFLQSLDDEYFFDEENEEDE